MYDFCAEHGVPHEACGKIVVATHESELPALDELERRGTANGLTGLRRLDAAGLREFEPHVTGIAGLHVPETGIVDYRAVTRAMAKVIAQHGGEVQTTSRVRKVGVRPDSLVLHTSSGEVRSRGLINCGGLQSDRVARMCGVEPGVRIVPFRGEYYELTPIAARLVRNLIYPVPDPRFPFLGVHFTRMIHGGVEAGPNAVLSLARYGYSKFSFNPTDVCGVVTYGGFWRMARRYWRTGTAEVWRSFNKRAFLRALQRLIPDLTLSDLAPGGAGVRAQAMEPSGALVDDFRIVRAPRMVHVLNAPSPGATASIAIGRHIADLAADVFGHAVPTPASPALVTG
jgi:L-2-hydroxyglutarate oxidase